MKVTKKVVYQVEDFDLKFEPIGDTIKITNIGRGFEVKYITLDDCAENPFDSKYQEGNGIFYHWKDYGREQLVKYCELLGYDIETREKIRKDDKDCVRIDKYEHSGVAYSVAGEGRNCQFDTSSVWAVWWPDKVLFDELKGLKGKARRNKCIEYARQSCELFNQWANGEVYCIVVETFNKDKEHLDYDICGGYYGYENAEAEVEG